MSIWYNDEHSPKKIKWKRHKKLFLFNFRYFFLTLSNKRNKVNGAYDRRPQQGGGAKVGVCPGGTT